MSSINLTTFLVYGHAHFMLSLYKQVFTNTRLGEKNIIPTSEKVHSSNKKEQQNAGGNGSEIPFCVGSFRSPYIKCLRILITVCPVFKDLCMFKNNQVGQSFIADLIDFDKPESSGTALGEFRSAKTVQVKGDNQ